MTRPACRIIGVEAPGWSQDDDGRVYPVVTMTVQVEAECLLPGTATDETRQDKAVATALASELKARGVRTESNRAHAVLRVE